MVICTALVRVFQGSVYFEMFFYSIKKRSFFIYVRSAELAGSLEHQMFQVMGKSRGFRRIIPASCTYGNVGLNTWFLVVDRQIDFQPVVQSIDTGIHQIAFHSLILVFLCHNRQPEGKQEYPKH